MNGTGSDIKGWQAIANTDTKYYFDANGLMVSDKWYYFYADGKLARSTKADGYEVDENGVRKMK